MSDYGDRISGFRQWIQDNLAPGLHRLDERTLAFTERVQELSERVSRNGEEVREVWGYLRSEISKDLSDIRQRLSKLEGGSDGLRKEIIADVKTALLHQPPDLSRGGVPLELASGEPPKDEEKDRKR